MVEIDNSGRGLEGKQGDIFEYETEALHQYT